MHTANYIYHRGEEKFLGFLAFNDKISGQRPAVIVVHDWSGRNALACEKAEQLAAMGYLGFAVDMYGQGRQGETIEEKQALMQPLLSDRTLLLERMNAALHAVNGLEEVDNTRIAVIGFCFGGLCALDLARSGAEIAGVVSFHGLLNKPDHVENNLIKAKILALHGYDDPMVSPVDVQAFCQEMTDKHVDWQVHQYGLTKHAFTNPLAHDNQLGTVYNQEAAKRSWLAMSDFLQEIIA